MSKTKRTTKKATKRKRVKCYAADLRAKTRKSR